MSMTLLSIRLNNFQYIFKFTRRDHNLHSILVNVNTTQLISSSKLKDIGNIYDILQNLVASTSINGLF